MHENHRLLRQATAPYHARLDATLGGGFDTRDAYAGYLQGMRGFLADAARVLGDDPLPRRLQAWLDTDRDVLGLGDVAPTDAAPEADTDASTATRLGWEYVVAGASLGARFLLRGARALGYDAGRGATFLAGHAVGEDWQHFLRKLEADSLTPAELPVLCAGAIDAFLAAERRMLAAQGSGA